MRNTWAAYKIDRQTGAVIWTVGSNHSSFKRLDFDAHFVAPTPSYRAYRFPWRHSRRQRRR